MNKKKHNVIKFSKHMDINVGFIILIVICLYIVISVIIYATSKKTVVYEVNSGSLSIENIYTALIERDEELVASEHSGTYNYYMHATNKADSDAVVYSVDEAGRVSEALSTLYDSELTDGDLVNVANMCSKYTVSYENNNFSSLYRLHDEMNDALTKLHANLVLSDIEQIVKDTDSSNLFHMAVTKSPGIIMYSYDNYMNIDEERLGRDLFDTSKIEKKYLLNNEVINTGDYAYRLIKSDDWNLYIELSEADATALSANKQVNLRFIDEDIVTSAGIEIIRKGEEYYGKISLHKFMINFADERFVRIELTQKCASGLKIPATSVALKSFYTIPIEYKTEGGLFIRMSYSQNGEIVHDTIVPTIYDEDENYCYVGMSDLNNGDILVKEADEKSQFVVGTIGERYGVYCVNKGYAVFKIVNILDQNEEYTIVEKGNSYGLAVYDHIVLDYHSVKENELVE